MGFENSKGAIIRKFWGFWVQFSIEGHYTQNWFEVFKGMNGVLASHSRLLYNSQVECILIWRVFVITLFSNFYAMNVGGGHHLENVWYFIYLVFLLYSIYSLYRNFKVENASSYQLCFEVKNIDASRNNLKKHSSC